VRLRKESIRDYVRIAAQILPKELNIKTESLDDMDDSALVSIIGEIREALVQYRRSTDAKLVDVCEKPPGILAGDTAI
jgi:hypothetical protein